MPLSVVRDGKVDDLSFRKHRGLWRPDNHVWNLFVGDELFGFVSPSHAWKDKWTAYSYSRLVRTADVDLWQCSGFATRLDAGVFIVKTHGYWKDN